MQHIFRTFFCHCFTPLQRTWNFLVAHFMEEKSYIFLDCFSYIATKIVKFVLLNHSAFVNIRVRSALRAFCPSRGTSSVRSGIQMGNGLDNQGGVSQYNTLLSFCSQFSLPSQVSITRFYFLLEYNFKCISTRAALLALFKSIYQWLWKKSKALNEAQGTLFVLE